ncbi:MAG: segregation/condensation protein A [Deltaproteobacteria bacterium]|jgi:segregation and condensation protein A|nr:segregation/condensation protein A [Deltaproteobacteria bacterium]
MSERKKLINFSVDFTEGDSFDGPLDLLLFLIKRNEVNIYDLPISLITTQYLEYLQYMERFNLDIAGDFLVMAATLAQIKSRMLLPDERGESDEPAEDPRMALVRPLIEYAKVQQAAEALGSRFLLDRDVFVRGYFEDFTEGDLAPEDIPQKFSLFELVEAWRKLASKPRPESPTLNFNLETVTIGERLEEIRKILIELKSAHFSDLSFTQASSMERSLSFLAILELARTGFLKLYQDTEEDESGPRLFLADPDADTSLSFDYK